MALKQNFRIGRSALLLLLSEEDDLQHECLINDNWRYCTGKVGSMEAHKVVAAVETAAKNNQIINKDLYREGHALYHAIIEALQGITRGEMQIGSVLRTVGLSFSVVRGSPYENSAEGEWVAVSLYGTIGAPVKGAEHETIGLGINHI